MPSHASHGGTPRREVAGGVRLPGSRSEAGPLPMANVRHTRRLRSLLSHTALSASGSAGAHTQRQRAGHRDVWARRPPARPRPGRSTPDPPVSVGILLLPQRLVLGVIPVPAVIGTGIPEPRTVRVPIPVAWICGRGVRGLTRHTGDAASTGAAQLPGLESASGLPVDPHVPPRVSRAWVSTGGPGGPGCVLLCDRHLVAPGCRGLRVTLKREQTARKPTSSLIAPCHDF